MGLGARHVFAAGGRMISRPGAMAQLQVGGNAGASAPSLFISSIGVRPNYGAWHAISTVGVEVLLSGFSYWGGQTNAVVSLEWGYGPAGAEVAVLAHTLTYNTTTYNAVLGVSFPVMPRIPANSRVVVRGSVTDGAQAGCYIHTHAIIPSALES